MSLPHPTIEAQFALAKKYCPPGSSCKIIAHPGEDNLQAIEIDAFDAFTISACEFEKPSLPKSSIIARQKQKKTPEKVQGFHVDVAILYPGTRDDPPDVDIKDVGDFQTFFLSLQKVLEMLLIDAMNNEAEAHYTPQYAEEQKFWAEARAENRRRIQRQKRRLGQS